MEFFSTIEKEAAVYFLALENMGVASRFHLKESLGTRPTKGEELKEWVVNANHTLQSEFYSYCDSDEMEESLMSEKDSFEARLDSYAHFWFDFVA